MLQAEVRKSQRNCLQHVRCQPLNIEDFLSSSRDRDVKAPRVGQYSGLLELRIGKNVCVDTVLVALEHVLLK